MLWDVLFGTRHLPPDRRAPTRVGIDGLDDFPRGFVAQLASPWTLWS